MKSIPIILIPMLLFTAPLFSQDNAEIWKLIGISLFEKALTRCKQSSPVNRFHLDGSRSQSHASPQHGKSTLHAACGNRCIVGRGNCSCLFL